MGDSLAVLIVLLQMISVCALIAIFWKVRRIHLSSFVSQELLRETHRETFAIYPQVVGYLTLEKILGLRTPLPPMRGWAGSPDFLYQVARRILGDKPEIIVECSSGVSTLVAARCCQLNRRGHVFSLEHESQFAEKTNAMLRDFELTDWATVVHAPLELGGDGRVWYRDAALPEHVRQIELLLVDGPPASIAVMARYPAMPRLMGRFAPRVSVMLDDADRLDEQRIVKQWASEFEDFKLVKEPAEKGLVILAREG